MTTLARARLSRVQINERTCVMSTQTESEKFNLRYAHLGRCAQCTRVRCHVPFLTTCAVVRLSQPSNIDRSIEVAALHASARTAPARTRWRRSAASLSTQRSRRCCRSRARSVRGRAPPSMVPSSRISHVVRAFRVVRLVSGNRVCASCCASGLCMRDHVCTRGVPAMHVCARMLIACAVSSCERCRRSL